MSYHTTIAHYKRKLLRKAETFNKPMEFPEYLIPFIGDKEEIRVADIGSGPIPTIGTILPGRRVILVASDILAKTFQDMLDAAGIIPVTPIEKQDATKLTYQDNSFDIVHCVNTLDHIKNIQKAISEAYRVCKPGGVLFLRHFRNGSKRKGYKGSHCWNFDKRDRGCAIWNEEESFFLDDIYKNVETTEDRWTVTATVIKCEI